MIARGVTLTTWLALIAAYLIGSSLSGTTPMETLAVLLRFLTEHPLGPLLYIIICFLRPLTLFSAGLLTIGAGMLYGPWLGLGVVTIGQNSGAMLAYALARGIGGPSVAAAMTHPRIAGFAGRLRKHAFEAVLTLRLMFTPYDLVNVAAGALRLPALPFLGATVLGSLTGSLTFLLFGASIGRVEALTDGVLPRIDLRLLLASLALLLVSLAIAWLVRRRAAAAEGAS
jgi:uncharacterized membrane protein YdjX (TVP38/TMEM64 family)